MVEKSQVVINIKRLKKGKERRGIVEKDKDATYFFPFNYLG